MFLGPSCVFTNVINPRAGIERKDEFRATLVRRGASVGANATILCGVELGTYCLVGAGAVVTTDVPDFAMVVGVPARQQGWVCRCGVRLSLADRRARCSECATLYAMVEDGHLQLKGKMPDVTKGEQP